MKTFLKGKFSSLFRESKLVFEVGRSTVMEQESVSDPNVLGNQNWEGLSQEEAERASRAVGIASRIVTLANSNIKDADKKANDEVARMIDDPHGLQVLVDIIDKGLRPANQVEQASYISEIMNRAETPEFLGAMDKIMFNIFKEVSSEIFGVGEGALEEGSTLKKLESGVVKLTSSMLGKERMLKWFSFIGVKAIESQVLGKTDRVLITGNDAQIKDHIKRRGENSDEEANWNCLGEYIMGILEADMKTQQDIDKLRSQGLSVLSTKASNLCPMIDPIAHEHIVQEMCGRLMQRLDAIKEKNDLGELLNIRDSYDPNNPAYEGDIGYKLLNLDMEEYAELSATVDMYTRVLSEPEYNDLQVGIALQAYIPDSFLVLKDLIWFAKQRRKKGGAPGRVRIVKGANKPMEAVHSSESGLEDPTFQHKANSDANWKRMIKYALQPENLVDCHVGIATHNALDASWALDYINENVPKHLHKNVRLEMLEGMANHVRDEMSGLTKEELEMKDILLYTPTSHKKKFLVAMAYLMRRFQEQGDPNNFLSKLFGLEVGSADWNKLVAVFLDSIKRMNTIPATPHRAQNRITEHHEPRLLGSLNDFRNSPTTDYSLPHNQFWLMRELAADLIPMLLASGRKVEDLPEHFLKTDEQGNKVINPDWMPEDMQWQVAQHPVMIGSKVAEGPRDTLECRDRSYPDIITDRFALATPEDIKAMFNLARTSEVAKHWSTREFEQDRYEIIAKIHAGIENNRGIIMPKLASAIAKNPRQGEGSVSEAADFADVYPTSIRDIQRDYSNLRLKDEAGVVTVISPFNFAFAITGGGVLKALSQGKKVVLKPSPLAAPAAYEFARICWEAGVPRDVLQVAICTNEVASTVVEESEETLSTGDTLVCDDKVIKVNPKAKVSAETGGKNVTYVSARADREQAIMNVVSSLLFNGQKCSATSILCIHSSFYNDPTFWEEVMDRVQSLRCGSAWDPASHITPLISKPKKALWEALNYEPKDGEEWVVKPQMIDGREDFWSPGLIKGIKPGSALFHLTELFGPVVACIEVNSIDEVIEIQKATGKALTSGIETTDHAEAEEFRRKSIAGLVYRGRATVGAEPLVQPFQGKKGSRRGIGAPPGSKDCAIADSIWEEIALPECPEITNHFALRTAAYRYKSSIGQETHADRLSRIWQMANQWQEKLDSGEFGEDDKENVEKSIAIAKSNLWEFFSHFSQPQTPPEKRIGQENITSYESLDGIDLIRVTPEDNVKDLMARLMASMVAGNRVVLSISQDDSRESLISEKVNNMVGVLSQSLNIDGLDLGEHINFNVVYHTDEELIEYIDGNSKNIAQIRYAHQDRVPEEVFNAYARNPHICLNREEPLMTARIEMLRSTQQSIYSNNYHRYGGELRPEDKAIIKAKDEAERIATMPPEQVVA